MRIAALSDPRASDQAETLLSELKGVLWSRVNPKCASLAVGYDPAALPRPHLLDALSAHFAPASQATGTSPTTTCPCSCSGEAAKNGKAVKRALGRFVAISAALGLVAGRKLLFGAVTAQTATSPLGLAALFFCLPLVRDGVKKLKQRRMSLELFLAAGASSAVFVGEALTAFEILWINSGAELLTAWIAERSRRSIAEILDLVSHHTFVLVDGVEVERAVQDLLPGDVIVVHTGEKIAVDGQIVQGEALLDEAPITGRCESAFKKDGDRVFAGTFVQMGVIHIKATHVGDSTYLSRVMRKVQDELENRAPIEVEADRLASRLVRMGFVATGLTFILTGSLWRAFTVLLVMACPCATVLAASTAVSASINAAARSRILIKGGRYLEEAGKCETVFFDKTGTLTTNEPVLQQTFTFNGMDENGLLRLASSAETHNHHPLALAVLREAASRNITPIPHTVCDYRLGMGMRAVVQGREVLVGNAKLMRVYDADVTPLEEQANRLREQGLTVLYVYQDKAPQGLLGFAAKVRPEAARVLERLRALGVKHFALVTGDEENAALSLAEALGVEECYASIMPEEKAAIVSRVGAERGRILMIGDGVNDALALTRADVGVSIGSAGSEAAVEAADVALAADNLEGLADVYELSQKTVRIARQNFWIATGSNIGGVLLGALGVLNPVTAGLVHIGHTLGVLANSSRLLAFTSGQACDLPEDKDKTNGFQHISETT